METPNLSACTSNENWLSHPLHLTLYSIAARLLTKTGWLLFDSRRRLSTPADCEQDLEQQTSTSSNHFAEELAEI